MSYERRRPFVSGYEKPINWRTSPIREARNWETIVSRKTLEETHKRLVVATNYFMANKELSGRSPNLKLTMEVANYNLGIDQLIEALKLVETMEGVKT